MRGKYFLVALSVFLLVLPAVSADILDDLEENLDKIDASKLPASAKKLLGNERINIYIKMDDGDTLVAGVVTKDAKIASFDKDGLDDPTLKAYTSEYTIKNIAKAKDKQKAVRDAIKNKEIRYEPVGIGNKVKYSTVGAAMRIYGWVHNLFK